MPEIVLSSSSNSIDKAIDKYRDSSSYTDFSSHSSSSGNTTKEYTSGVPKVPLEVFQEHLTTRAASESQADTSTSVLPSTPVDEVEIVYSCAVGIPSKTNEKGLTSLRSWYQISNDLNPKLAVCWEWCCQPYFGIGIYEAYLLKGLRLPLNAFARELLTRLGLGVCQFTLNAWRLVVSM